MQQRFFPSDEISQPEQLIVNYLKKYNLYTPELEKTIYKNQAYWDKISLAIQLLEPLFRTSEYVNLIFQYPEHSIELIALLNMLYHQKSLDSEIKGKIIKNAASADLLNSAIQLLFCQLGNSKISIEKTKDYLKDILDNADNALPLCNIILYLNQYHLLEYTYEFIIKNVSFSIKIWEKMLLEKNRGNPNSTLSQQIPQMKGYHAVELFFKATEVKDYKNAELILKNNIDTNSLSSSQLFTLFAYGDDDINVRKLIRDNLLLNDNDEPYPEALHSAIDNKRFELAEFLLTFGADCTIKDASGNTPLHKAISNKSLVASLLNKGADVHVKNCLGETPIDLAQNQPHSANRTEILTLLNAKPDTDVIECYDEKETRFIPVDVLKIKEQLKTSPKDAVVLFFAENSTDVNYVERFYKDASFARTFCNELNDFTVFRVIISDTQQMEPNLFKIRSFLPNGQQIIHVMINGHANSHSLRLGKDKDDRYSCLYSNDAFNNSAMKKTLMQLGKHGTLALFGCSTASGEENMTKEFSKEAIAHGRLVMGAPDITSWVHYTTKPHKKRKIPLALFDCNYNTHQLVEVYKNGQNLARCQNIEAMI